MKKIYLIFFLGFVSSLYIAAQQKVIIPTQTQPATKSILPAKSNIAAQPAKPQQAANKATSIGKGKPAAPRKRRIASAGTIYGNEWITYSQYYYKIKVAQDGIYRMDSTTLAKAGLRPDTINNLHYQIFFRGQQQYIYVKSRTKYLSEVNGDYIEFYGQHNDGTLDSTLYYNINFVPNPYYSLFIDTSTYYLTWTSSTSSLRMTEQTDTNWSEGGLAASYVMASAVIAARAYSNAASNNLASSLYLQNGTYFQGQWYVDATFTPNDPRFTQNSAWTIGWLGQGSGYPASEGLGFNLSYVYATGPNAFMRTVVLGVSNGNCTFNLSVGSLPLLNAFPFNTSNTFAALDTTFTFPASNISGSFSVTFTNNATSSSGNIIAPTYIYLSYPHTTYLGNASTFMMAVPDNGSGSKAYLDFTGINSSGDTVRMYDLTNHKRFWAKPEFGGYNVLVPNNIIPGSGLKQCYLTSDAAINTVTNLTPVGTNYTNGGIGNGQFTNLSTGPENAYILITHPSLWSSAQNYAYYRQNLSPIKYHTITANVEELYDQFGYGVDDSPLGIRRFCNYAVDKWPSVPSDLFLFGKGIHTPLFRPDTATWTRAQLLVPSYGYPSSDILFTNGLGNSTLLEPAIPTGRLAAPTNTEATTYLDKVEVFEGTAPALWMKNVAHFAGGSDASEEEQFAGWLNDYAATIEDTLFGAHVSLFQKSTPAPISGTLTDSITSLIDNGVSIMTFFGHASGSNWDESVDYPSDYTNTGKYPFMIADGCFSGDIFQPIGQGVSTVSEQFVLESPGAIGFLSTDDVGNAQQLYTYTQQLYNDISYRPFYRKPIGSIIQNTIAKTQAAVASTQDNPNYVFTTFTCLEMTLHADPAITINDMDSLPDYAVNSQSISFSPATVTALLDSFTVNVTAYNYGEALNQPVRCALTRIFPNGASVPYTFTFPNLYYESTISIRMPVNDSTMALGAGINNFSVYVDPSPSYPEITYTNNSLTTPVSLNIASEAITPIWPYDYAIIPHDTVSLKGSTNDPFAPQETYIFEIDTSHSFNSPLFRSDTVTNTGGVIKASPYDKWGTTHFHGPLKKSSGNAANKIAATRVITNGNSAPITNNMSGQLNAIQTKPVINKPIVAQPNFSPVLKQAIIQKAPLTQSKGIVEQNNNITIEKSHSSHGPTNLSFINNAVYYWRVRGPVDTNWALTSFQYISKYNGWGQSNFFQYDNDEIYNDSYNFISFNSPTRNWGFNTYGYTLQCTAFLVTNQQQLYATDYTIDNITYAGGGCQDQPGILIAVIDPVTIIPWNTGDPTHQYGNINDIANADANQCNSPTKSIISSFLFWDNSVSQMEDLVTMLKDVPPNYYILAYSWINGVFKTSAGLDTSSLVISEFESLGATQMGKYDSTPGNTSTPWIFFVQKGNPATAMQEYMVPGPGTDSVTLTTVLKSNGRYGAITSSLIGPASKYDSLSWQQHAVDKPPYTDSTRLNILGIEPSGTTQTLISNISPLVANMYISSINAKLYPYIQLLMYTRDALNPKPTPGQMNYWRVFYQPVPEIAMNPNIYTYYHADTLEYGDVLNFQTTVQNISDWPIDSTQLLIWTTNTSNNVTYHNPKRYVKALKPGDTAKVSLLLPDANQSTNTLTSIWFEINPEDYPNTRLEQFHFNDYASKTFYSYGDKINPVVDVTFDGIHILNNDIVSAKPNILITFMDENKYLALNNPNDFKVYLNPVSSSTLTPVQFTFTPATLPQNRCSLLVTPTLTDGTYQLTVQGTDISGNLSAINSYKVNFQVITKSMISEVLNYPNPFSTSTRFVFILTGEQIPTIFKIQIMTITGKIVREINEDEIGPIHIGRNITQYAWDGTDQYGSKLANGVYLYRVVTSINGQSIDDYQTGADQYFTKGWGKMYLMR